MYVGDHQNWINGPAGCGGSSSFSSIQNFLQDIPGRVRMPVIEPYVPPGTVHHYRSKIIAGYAQDDWKMLSNLTVNIGLRYEMSTIPTETDDKINYLETLWQNPGACTANAQGIGICPGFFHQTFQHNPTLKNFEPRVGFAWDPFHDGKTSVRGGFGYFDALPLPYELILNNTSQAPFRSTFAALGDNNGGLYASPAQGVWPLGIPALTNIHVNNPQSRNWRYVDNNIKRNYIYQYNLNIQRQVTANTTILVGYTGSRAFHN